MILPEDEAYAIAFSFCTDVPGAVYEVFKDKIGNAAMSKQLLHHIGIREFHRAYPREELLAMLIEPYRGQIEAVIAEMLMATL